MKNRFVTVCKEVNGEMRTRNIPVQSWNSVKGKRGANGWKECTPTSKAVEDFPELRIGANAQTTPEVPPQGEVAEVDKSDEDIVMTEEVLQKLQMKDLLEYAKKRGVDMAVRGIPKKAVVIEKILNHKP